MKYIVKKSYLAYIANLSSLIYIVKISVLTYTALRARHAGGAVSCQPQGVKGIFEATGTYFKESQKDNRRLVASRNDLVPVLVGRLRGHLLCSNLPELVMTRFE